MTFKHTNQETCNKNETLPNLQIFNFGHKRSTYKNEPKNTTNTVFHSQLPNKEDLFYI